jgi:hypothetical protein
MIAVCLAALQSTCDNGASRITAWRFQCPDESVLIQGVDTSGGQDTVLDTITSIPLSEPVVNIPEYHDCQRFIDSSGYGSVYAIFAAFLLDTVSGGQAAPVATIYTPDGTYPTLGIAPGFNCLLLFKAGDTWNANMVPRGQGKENADCTSRPPNAAATTLQVKAQPIEGATFDAGDYPPVARWDWDSVNGKQYIGIRCGAEWCEVGATDFVQSEGYSGSPLSFDPIPGIVVPARATERVQRIKGWYDAQRLASGTAPGDVRGLLIPHPALDLINWRDDALDFYKPNPGWVHVAYAIMDGDYNKWNLKMGKNKISFCYGTAAPTSCNVPAGPRDDGSSMSLTGCKEDPTDATMRWWAKTESRTAITYTCVRRMDHLGQINAWKVNHPGVVVRIAGTARWKFLWNDESTWMSCPTGCCTKH